MTLTLEKRHRWKNISEDPHSMWNFPEGKPLSVKQKPHATSNYKILDLDMTAKVIGSYGNISAKQQNIKHKNPNVYFSFKKTYSTFAFFMIHQ